MPRSVSRPSVSTRPASVAARRLDAVLALALISRAHGHATGRVRILDAGGRSGEIGAGEIRVGEVLLPADPDTPVDQVRAALAPRPCVAAPLQEPAPRQIGEGCVLIDGGAAPPADAAVVMRIDPAGRPQLTCPDPDLADAAALNRQLHQVMADLAAARRHRTALRLADLSLLDGPARAQVLAAAAGVTRPWPRDAALGRLMERAAATYGAAPALIFSDRVLSHAGLEAASRRVAAGLMRHGLPPGAAIGVFSARSAAAVIAIAGIVRAGCVYVPLDPDLPDQRLKVIADLAGLGAVITGPAADGRPAVMAGRAAALTARVLPLAALEETPAPEVLPDPGTGGSDVAEILFTSGSTGVPKGVALTHRGIARLVTAHDMAGFAPGRRIAQTATLAFDIATLEIWGTLITGATLIGVPKPVLLDAAAFRAHAARHRIDTMVIATSLLHGLAAQDPGAFTGIRAIHAGGEPPDPVLFRRVLAESGPEILNNGYGPTETGVFATMEPVVPAGDPAAPVASGRPIGATTVHVLDDRLQPVPDGVAGEIWIGGDGVARGYVGDDVRTRAAFHPDPFSDDPEARLYRTGDRGIRMASGTIRVTGRIDGQLKIRGYRIEPEEVQAALSGAPGISRVLVGAWEVAPGDRRLAAWVETGPSPSEPPRALAARLRAWLTTRLPDWMIPAWFVPVPAFTLTVNGKIDRRRLPAPDAGLILAEQAWAAAIPIEAGTLGRVVGLFREVLRNPLFTADDGFLEAGGNSLLAARLQTAIGRAFGTAPPIALLQTPQTARVTAAWLAAAAWAGDAPQATTTAATDFETVRI